MKYLFLIIFSLLLLSSSILDNPKLPKPFKKQFKFVPSGLSVVDGDTLSVQAFYMLEHEVTNGQYREFLSSLNDENDLEKASVQNEMWTKTLANLSVEPMEKMYHVHEAYNDYPVVNITKEAAKMYCEWLENKINKELLKSQRVEVRLPKQSEFIRAGLGNNFHWKYAWGNDKLTNSEGKYLCNFTRIPYSIMSRGEDGEIVLNEGNVIEDHISDGALFTAVKSSYYPSTFEIYNLNGNVAEWLGDSGSLAAGGSWHDFGYDVRLQSVKTYETASPMVGFRPVVTVVSE